MANSLKNTIFRIIGLSFLFSLTSCVFSFTGGTIRGTVKILPVENKSDAYGIESVINPSLVEAFNEDGRLKPSDKGEYTLKIVVDRYKREPSSYETSGVVKEYRYTISADVLLEKNTDSTKVLDRKIQSVITLSGDKDESEGIKGATEKLAEEIIRLVLEQW